MRSVDEVGFDLSLLKWKPITPEQFAYRVADASIDEFHCDEHGNFDAMSSKSASRGKDVVTVFYLRKGKGSNVSAPFAMLWRTGTKWLYFEYLA